MLNERKVKSPSQYCVLCIMQSRAKLDNIDVLMYNALIDCWIIFVYQPLSTWLKYNGKSIAFH